MKKKVLLIALAAILLVGASIGGTLAWLTDKTATVTNTFTVGKVGATLTETGTNNNLKSYHVVPGQPYSKDPKAGVTEGSEDAYLFVKIDKSTNFNTSILKYVVPDGWTVLDAMDYPNVYYRIVNKNDTSRIFSVLKDDEVVVDGAVTETQLATVKDATLSFTVYAIQKDNLATALAAWAAGSFW